MSTDRFFHYTVGLKLQPILDAGELRPSNAGAPNERPLLWFSLHPRWEPTATKLVVTPQGVRRLTLSQQRDQLGGCLRFELSPSVVPLLLPWADACRAAGTSRDERRALERVGKRRGGDPKQWYAHVASVSLADCKSVERMDDAEQWVPLELERVEVSA